MSNQIIPLTNAPNQSFAITLSVDGAPLTLNLSIQFNSMAGYWMLSVADASNRPLLNAIPMITGSYPGANILKQQRYMKIGSAYLLNVSSGNTDYPNSTNLATDYQFLWGDTPTV